MGALLSNNREKRDFKLLRSVLMIRSRNVCCKCNTHFDIKKNLDKHMERVHAGTSYTCDSCDLISWTWSMFQQHIYACHNDVIFCPYCYKAHDNYSNLVTHWKTHEPFECNICNNTFITQKSLRKHRFALH
ncbi:Transcription factor IIIA [Cyphomyrmex costatus]|uniref:Transcription factor IIIA n=1 Tax=Cyphomyrmex costatus TaxID=456900 RepID=A0A195C6P3_9HYME|nr:Transcription factor IIIA [Cyphomyrmex costatus]